MMLDNDTLLPSDLFIPIHWLEQNEKIRALTFTIRAQNLTNVDVWHLSTVSPFYISLRSPMKNAEWLVLFVAVLSRFQGTRNLLTCFQDLEYKKAGVMKLLQVRYDG
jgi:hypothetical protein